MSSMPDPEEERVTGLEPGGGVPPGETPPAEGTMAEDVGHEEDQDDKAPRTINALWIVMIGIIVVLVVLFFVGRAVNLFGLFGSGVVTPLIGGLTLPL